MIMDFKQCCVSGCQNSAQFICQNSHELFYCLDHYSEHKLECRMNQEELGNFIDKKVRIIPGNIKFDPDKTVLKGSLLFSVKTKICPIPIQILNATNGLSFAFVDTILEIGNGQNDKVQKLCLDYSIALKEIIYNIEIDYMILTTEVNELYCKLHSEKQSVISEVLSDFLNSQEEFYNMPKTITKNLVVELELETIKQNFIYEFFMKDGLKAEQLYSAFCKIFNNFLQGKEIQFKNFEDCVEKLKIKIETLYLNYRKKLLGVSIERWVKDEFQISSVSVSDLLENHENTVKIVSLYLKKSVLRLNSVTKLGTSGYIIIIYIEKNSYVILYTEGSSYILSIFYNSDYTCAEGSNREQLLLLNRTENQCELFSLNENEIEKNCDIDLKLTNNEIVQDLIFIQGKRPKIIFSTNKYPINHIYYCGVRTLINFSFHTEEKLINLFYYRNKGVIILKSSKKIAVFTEYLEKLGEFSFDLQDFHYLECNERLLKVIGRQDGYLIEVVLDVKLDYPETLNRKLSLLPGPIEALTKKSYEGKVFHSTINSFDQFFKKKFDLC